MNKGDIILHTGVVTESASDMSISVRVPAYAGDIVQEDVKPAYVCPVRWRPREGDLVTIMQRVNPGVVSDDALSWLGWEWDDGNTHLVPPWIEPGQVCLFGVDGRTVIVLDDDETLSGNDRAGVLRVGTKDADQPVVLGTVYRAAWARVLLLLRDWINADWAWKQAAGVALGAAGAPIPGDTLLYFERVITSNPIPPPGPGSAVLEQLVGATVPVGEDVLSELPDHLSDFIMVAKESDPNPYTGEED